MAAATPIETDRLRLVPWSAGHAELLVRLSSLPQVVRYVGDGSVWPRARAIDAATAQREHWASHGFGWRAAVLRETGEPVGLIALSFSGEGTRGVDPHEHEVGWWLDPSVWGRGLAREGAAAIRDEALARVGATSVLARIQPGNAPSIAVARAIGMTFERETTGRQGEPLGVWRVRAADLG